MIMVTTWPRKRRIEMLSIECPITVGMTARPTMSITSLSGYDRKGETTNRPERKRVGVAGFDKYDRGGAAEDTEEQQREVEEHTVSLVVRTPAGRFRYEQNTSSRLGWSAGVCRSPVTLINTID